MRHKRCASIRFVEVLVMPAVAVGESRPLLSGEMTGFNAALEVVVLTLLAASFCAIAPALQMNGT